MFLFSPFLVDFSISFLWRSPCIRYFAAPRGLRQGFSTRVSKYLHFYQFNGINLLIIFRICIQATLWGGNVI